MKEIYNMFQKCAKTFPKRMGKLENAQIDLWQLIKSTLHPLQCSLSATHNEAPPMSLGCPHTPRKQAEARPDTERVSNGMPHLNQSRARSAQITPRQKSISDKYRPLFIRTHRKNWAFVEFGLFWQNILNGVTGDGEGREMRSCTKHTHQNVSHCPQCPCYAVETFPRGPDTHF